ncbi:hypothetical protein DPEC_G00242780 [Dallia pectoralis]|uniref:Uncharacterized protein n=1 Tax=Dallia pectoralis TaxID=75939 RepID=A0ACC2FVD1_DALPE|nr:hypothetical protein DPEC_G00242780 [Dallia pectoralis]
MAPGEDRASGLQSWKTGRIRGGRGCAQGAVCEHLQALVCLTHNTVSAPEGGEGGNPVELLVFNDSRRRTRPSTEVLMKSIKQTVLARAGADEARLYLLVRTMDLISPGLYDNLTPVASNSESSNQSSSATMRCTC